MMHDMNMKNIVLVVDVRKTTGEISPLWFGHNLEHTRYCIWRGLSAQLVRNRKFAGMQEPNGVAQQWYRIGPRKCWHFLEQRARGSLGNPYTTRFDRSISDPEHARQRQKIQSFGDGTPVGIGQQGIFLADGRKYELRVALQSDRELLVRIHFVDQKLVSYFDTTVNVKPKDWRELHYDFVASETDENARIEITFDKTGTLCIGMVSLLPADHFHGMRRDVIQLLKEISVPILRWPGGNFAGDYRWKDGLLPVDRRVPLRNHIFATLPYTDGYDTHEIGTDEFIALCRELGAEPYITINMSLEKPDEEAAAWVEYCNGSPNTKWGRIRAEHGHPEPYNVRYWSLGNEMGFGHMKGPNEPHEYARIASACAKAMKNVDPSIFLTACGIFQKTPRKIPLGSSLRELGITPSGWYKNWDQFVISEAGTHFDYISYHNFAPVMNSYLGDEGKREFRRIVSSPSKVLQLLKEARILLDTYAPAAKFIGFSFDEWSVRYNWFQVATAVRGVYTASMLNMFCREARKAGMIIGASFEPVEGSIIIEPGTSRRAPAGQVFSLFRSHQGNQLIEAKVSTENTKLDLAASVDDEKNRIVITAVNLSPDETGFLEIALNNIGTATKADGVLLRSPDFLPGSEFSQETMNINVKEGNKFSLSMPRYSVARILVDYCFNL